MIFYKNTEQISEPIEYEFKLPKYGKSTTDPTFYEPSATRIANMRKSAAAGKSLYDFDGSDLPKIKNKNGQLEPDWSKQNISKARIVPGRKPGLTQEEISQAMNDTQFELEASVEKRNKEALQDQKDIKKAQETLKSLSTQEADASGQSE